MHTPSRGEGLAVTTAIRAFLEAEKLQKKLQKEVSAPAPAKNRRRERVDLHPVVILSDVPIHFITPKRGRGIPVYRGMDRRTAKKLLSNMKAEKRWAHAAKG